MALYGVESVIKFWSWNTLTNEGVASDSANFTLTLRRDGANSSFVGTVNELGGGLYEAVISATLMQAYEVSLFGTTSTTDATIFPIESLRTVRLPNVTPGATGGLPTVDATNGVLTATQQSRLEKLNVSGTIAHSDAAATYKADVTGLSTFDASTDTVTTDAASRAASKADVSGLLTTTAYNTSLPTNFNLLAIDGSGQVVASNGGSGGLTQSDVRAAVGLASANLDTQIGTLTTTAQLNARTLLAADYFDPATDDVTLASTDVNIVRVAGTAVTGIDDFKANVDGLATTTALAAAKAVVDANATALAGIPTDTIGTGDVPTNFGTLSINASGQVSASNITTPPTAEAIATQVDTTLSANHGADSWEGGGAGGGLTQGDVRQAVGLATANLDTQLAGIKTTVDTTGQTVATNLDQKISEITIDASGLEINALTVEQAAQLALTPEIKAKTDLIGDGTAIVFQPMTADGDEITIVRYDSYTTDMNRSMSWDFPAAEFGDWTGKEVNWKATGTRPNNVVGPVELTVSGAGTEDQAATLELSSDDTDAEPGRYDWAVVVTDPSDPDFRLTARVGCMEVQDNPYSPG